MSFSVKYGDDPWLRWDTPRQEFEVVKALPVTWVVDGVTYANFVVKAGFYTDLASIPRWATVVIPKLGHHVRAAVVHDWTYRKVHHEGLSRTQGDMLFLHGMIVDRVSRFQRTVIYRAVRVGGGKDWASDRKEILEDDEFETIVDN